MRFQTDFIKEIRMRKASQMVYRDNLKNSGRTLALCKAAYLGGHPDHMGRKKGEIVIKSVGLFFKTSGSNQFLFIPVEEVVKAEFSTGEELAQNEVMSRILAYTGFRFAFKKKEREKHMYLKVDVLVQTIVISILFETDMAGYLSSAITKMSHDYAKGKVVENGLSLVDTMKEIHLLRAMSVITEEEFVAKKKELLARI